MKRYPKYKDSGIEWIGEIPEHWIVTYLKRICLKITDGSHFSPETKDSGFPYITVQDIKDNGIDFKNCKYISEEEYLSLKKGGCQPDKFDILLTKDGTIGKAVVIKQNRDFVILSSLGLITPNLSRIISDYLRYYLISGINIDQMFSFIRGSALTRLTINLIKQLHVVYPPIPEQQAIANYLDRKTSQIDTLIEKKQRLIDLLKEQRVAIINHAVTKGLNPDVKQKDSGIEWLGEIPEHWELRKVGRSFNLIGSGTTPKSENIGYYENGTIKWVITGDLNDGILDKTSKKITQKALDEYTTLKIYPVGTILIAMYGATIGKISLLNFEGCVNQACCALSDSPYLTNKFTFYWFLANKQHIINMSFGGGQPNISQEVIRSLKIPTPPSSEQQAITYYLDVQTTRIDKSIEKKDKQIALLKEYRTALISEVVTGKIDVRDSGIQEVIHI
jgi:type I restriction enzyme S subunit